MCDSLHCIDWGIYFDKHDVSGAGYTPINRWGVVVIGHTCLLTLFLMLVTPAGNEPKINN